MGKGRKKLLPIQRKVGKGIENRKQKDGEINMKVSGIAL